MQISVNTQFVRHSANEQLALNPIVQTCQTFCVFFCKYVFIQLKKYYFITIDEKYAVYLEFIVAFPIPNKRIPRIERGK